MTKPKAWLIHFQDIGGGDCIYDHYEPIAAALEANPSLVVEPLFTKNQISDEIHDLTKAFRYGADGSPGDRDKQFWLRHCSRDVEQILEFFKDK